MLSCEISVRLSFSAASTRSNENMLFVFIRDQRIPRENMANFVVNIVQFLTVQGCLQTMGLLPDTYNCGLCIRWECRERFPRHHFSKETAS